MSERKLKDQDMSDKLKSKLSAIFSLPKSTYSAPNMSASNNHDPPRRSSNVPSGYRVPIVFTDREVRQRRQQTLESDNAREELLKQGIKVRDFQVEADAKKYGGMAGGEVRAQTDPRVCEGTMEAKDTVNATDESTLKK